MGCRARHGHRRRREVWILGFSARGRYRIFQNAPAMKTDDPYFRFFSGSYPPSAHVEHNGPGAGPVMRDGDVEMCFSGHIQPPEPPENRGTKNRAMTPFVHLRGRNAPRAWSEYRFSARWHQTRRPQAAPRFWSNFPIYRVLESGTGLSSLDACAWRAPLFTTTCFR